MTKPQVYQQNDVALGCDVELRLKVADERQAERIFTALWRQIDQFEARFSRFLADSELTAFNMRAGHRVKISPEFGDLLKRSMDYASYSQGAFNPFVLPDIQRAGYVGSLVRPDSLSQTPDYRQRHVASWRALELGDGWARIPSGTAIDLGGIGKGYLADKLAANLDKIPVLDYSLSLGGDTICKNRQIGLWSVNVQSAVVRDQNIAQFESSLAKFAIATSGATRNKLGRRQRHIIDPDTGQPLDGEQLTCTVAADNATAADVMAMLILIKGTGFAGKLVKEGKIAAALTQVGEEIIALGHGWSGIGGKQTEGLKGKAYA